MTMLVLLASLFVHGAAGISNIVLNNGVKMPSLALQPEKYPVDSIAGIVKMALGTGINSIDAATHEQCQLQVGAALAGIERKSYFLTAGILLDENISSGSAYDTATSHLRSTLSSLGVQYVDLMVVSRPSTSCRAIQEQWRALEDFYAAGKARAIGVRMYCPSSLKCIQQTAKVAPAVNQIFFHVGMGADPEGFLSAFNKSGAVTQSIRALDSGELVSGKLVSNIGKAHRWSGAQVSMRWILDRGALLSVPMSNQSHIEQALAIYNDHLEADELRKLDSATAPKDTPSFFCPSADSFIV